MIKDNIKYFKELHEQEQQRMDSLLRLLHNYPGEETQDLVLQYVYKGYVDLVNQYTEFFKSVQPQHQEQPAPAEKPTPKDDFEVREHVQDDVKKAQDKGKILEQEQRVKEQELAETNDETEDFDEDDTDDAFAKKIQALKQQTMGGDYED